MKKSERKARKRSRHHKAAPKKIVTCDGCGATRPDHTGNHDSAWSVNGVTWDGLAVVAFCQWCGCDTCH